MPFQSSICIALTGFLYSRLITTFWPASVKSWLSSCLRRPQRFYRYSTRLLRWSIFPASATFAVWPLSTISYQSRQSRLPRSNRCSTLQHVFRPLSVFFPASVGLDFRLLSASFLPLLILIFLSRSTLFWPRLFFTSVLCANQFCGSVVSMEAGSSF